MEPELIARTRAKNVLNELIAVLNSNTRESHWVWDIIAALRGPDDDVRGLEKQDHHADSPRRWIEPERVRREQRIPARVC